MRAAPVILVLVLSACTRQMAGLVHTPDGAPLGRAEYTYEEDVFGSGTVTATMPDGEFFKGSYVMVETRATPYKATSVFATTSILDDRYNAVLFSDRNNSMRCLFRGDILHGIGACEVSDGRRVDVQW